MSPARRQPPQAHAPSCVLHSHTRGPSAHAAWSAVVGSPSLHLIRVCAALALHLFRTLLSCISFSPSLLLSFSSRVRKKSALQPPKREQQDTTALPPYEGKKEKSLLPPTPTYEISTAPRLSSPASRARTMFLAVASMQSASWLSFLPHILGKKSSSSNWATPKGASPVRATRPMN